MPPRQIDKNVVIATAKLFLGESRQEIDNVTGLSGGSQDLIMHYIYEVVGEDDFKSVRQLMQHGRKRNIAPKQVEISYNVALKLFKAGIDLDDFDKWLGEVYSQSQKLKMSAQQIGETLFSMWELAQDSDLTPSGIMNELRKVLREIADKRVELAELVDQKANDEREAQESMRKNNATRAQVQQFVDQKEALEEIGISFSNRDKFLNVWKNIDELGYSAKDAVNVLSETASVKKELASAERELREVKVQTENERKDLASLRTEIGNERAGYGEYQKLRSLGFDAPMLASIRKTAEGIMTVNGLDGRGAAKKLSNDIATQYDAKIGFERIIEEHKKNIEELATEIEDKKKQSHSMSKRLDGLQKEAEEVRKDLGTLKEDAEKFLTDIQANFRLSSGISKEILDMLKARKNELSGALQQTVSSALTVESLAPIGKAMSGERGVPLVSVIGSILEVLKLLESKVQHQRDLMWEKIREARTALEDAARVPIGQNPTT